jgi:hypothetical protein
MTLIMCKVWLHYQKLRSLISVKTKKIPYSSCIELPNEDSQENDSFNFDGDPTAILDYLNNFLSSRGSFLLNKNGYLENKLSNSWIPLIDVEYNGYVADTFWCISGVEYIKLGIPLRIIFRYEFDTAELSIALTNKNLIRRYYILFDPPLNPFSSTFKSKEDFEMRFDQWFKTQGIKAVAESQQLEG